MKSGQSGTLWCALAVAVGLLATSCSSGGEPGGAGPTSSSVQASTPTAAAGPSGQGAPSSSGNAAPGGSATTAATAGSVTEPTGAPVPGTAVAAALATVPSGAAGFEFVDHAALKTRWGLADLDSSVDVRGPQWQEFVEKSRTGPGGGLASYIIPMIDDFGWSGLDVAWEVGGHTEGVPKRVYRMRDGLDMQTVIQSLDERGFARSGSDDRPFFRFEMGKTSAVPAFFAVTVLPAQHLLVIGEDADAVLSAIDDPTTSMAGDPAVARLLAGAPNPEYLYLTAGAGACSTVVDALGASASPEAVTKIKERYAGITDGWHPIVGWAATVTGSDGVLSTGFASAGDAAADADARVKYLEDGDSMAGRRSLASMFSVTDSRVDGPVLRVDVALSAATPVLPRMIYQRDTPWALCP